MMIIALAIIIRRPILYVIKIKTNNKINNYKNNNTKLIQKEAIFSYELILQCPLMIYNIPGEVV